MAALAVLVLAACGDDNGTTDAQPTTAEAPEGGSDDPAVVFQEFQTALADGDTGKACGLLAPSAIKQTEKASIGGACETWVDEVSGAYDKATRDELRATRIEDTKVTGDNATVEYIAFSDVPLTVELQRSGDTWKISKLAEAV
jgi:hypothetical protein